MHSRQQKLEIFSGKLSTASGVKINQSSGRRSSGIDRLEPIVSCSKVSPATR